MVAGLIALPFLVFLGLLALPPDWPAAAGLGLAAAALLLMLPGALEAGTPRAQGPVPWAVLAGTVVIAAAGQRLRLRSAVRLAPLALSGVCLVAALVLLPVLVGV